MPFRVCLLPVRGWVFVVGAAGAQTVLVELGVEGAAVQAEGAGGVRAVSPCLIERGDDEAALVSVEALLEACLGTGGGERLSSGARRPWLGEQGQIELAIHGERD